MDRKKQKRFLAFITKIKLLVDRFGIRKAKFGYRYWRAILLGSAVTTKRAADKHVFKDEIFWAFFEKGHIDLRFGFEFDGGFSFKCNFNIRDFFKQFKTTVDPLAKMTS